MIKTVVQVEGMMCGMCEAHVNDAVRKAFPVKKVTSSYAKNKTEILSEQPLDSEALTRAIQSTGYTVAGIHTEVCEKKGHFPFFRHSR